jgi:hypothetical protein
MNPSSFKKIRHVTRIGININACNMRGEGVGGTCWKNGASRIVAIEGKYEDQC